VHVPTIAVKRRTPGSAEEKNKKGREKKRKENT
jgi:hypothetical protein